MSKTIDRLANEADSLHNKATDIIGQKGIRVPLEGMNDQAIKNLGYPAEFTVRDPREEKLALVRHLGHEWQGSNVQIPLPSELIDYYITQKKHVEFAEWEKWVQDNYDLSDPSQVKMLKEIMPEYFERRLEYIKKRLGLIFQLAKIDLMGPEGKEDLMLLYEVQRGDLPKPNLEAVFDEEVPGDEARRENFEAGVFNLRQLFGAERNKKATGVAVAGIGRLTTGLRVKDSPGFFGYSGTPAVYSKIDARNRASAGV